jgi:hypothetical protein
MSNRSSFSTLTLIALLSWGGLLWFTYAVPPGPFLAFVVFFLILAVALTSTGAPIAYMLDRHFSSTQPTVQSAVRRGALFALIVVLNLMLRALSSWNVFTAILIVVAVVVVEVVALARK